MTDFILDHLLSLILWTPALAAALLFLLPGRERILKAFAVGASLAPLAFSIFLWLSYDGAAAGFQFEERLTWYAAIGSDYHLAVDGISIPLVLLAALITPLALLMAVPVREPRPGPAVAGPGKVRIFLALFLLLETGMLGVFLSMDLLLFFVFWEAGLVPMYFLIQQWGGEKRDHAALKFLLYTMGASLGFLLAIQVIRLAAGSFDLRALITSWPALADGTLFGLPLSTVKTLTFWGMTIAFAVKVPLWPFHTWLPDAHTEAPTAGSMILAGVLLKLGGYGFIRLVLPLFPAESAQFAPALAVLAVAAIVLGALASWAQNDFKRLVAYSSVNHMGFVILGVAAAALAGTDTAAGSFALRGAVLQMFTHGLSAAGMFLLVGALYDRAHTRNLEELGGLFPRAPVYGGILIFTALGSLGLPGLGGFISELMVILGSWQVFPLLTGIAMIGLFFTGAYILKAIGKVLHGALPDRWKDAALEIGAREALAAAPLMALLLATGVWPAWILNMIGTAIR
ncbi:MAG: NADH-quinone oxidoreductase subunit M [Anaerolineales bacterium]|nr:NADH-quinone oxidoreductase subunit M [Anaerolineales bacterium]